MRALLPLLLLAACQSYPAGVQAMCQVPKTCGAPCQTGDAASRSAAMARHAEAQVTNSAARSLFDALASADPPTKARLLREEAKAAGVEDCPLADAFERG